MRNHAHNASDRTHDFENSRPTYGPSSCSYAVREGSKDQSRACNRQFELQNNERDMYSNSPATDDGNRCESIYLTVRRRQPSENSPVKPSVQGVPKDKDFRQANSVVGWERCTVFDGENGSCLAPETKDEGDEQSVEGVRRFKKEEGDDQMVDKYTLKQSSKTRHSLRVERPSPMEDKKFKTAGGSISGSEINLKEMTTQQKGRILINTNNCRPSHDLNSCRMNYSHASPERCRSLKPESKSNQQDYQGQDTDTQSSLLPRSKSVIAVGRAPYWSPSKAAAVDAQTAGQRNTNVERSSFQYPKVNGNEHDKLAPAQTAQVLQGPQLGTEYNGASWAFNSRGADFMNRLSKISEGMRTDLDESPATTSILLERVEPLSPTLNSQLMRKVEDLEKQIQDERKEFQVVAEGFAEQQMEADKNAQQMQDDWDGKMRELQKEKYALSIRLQSTETAHLASLLAGQGSVQAQAGQSAIQSAQSLTQPENGSASQHCLSSHRHREEFLKESETDEARKKSDRGNAPHMADQDAIKIKQESVQHEVVIRGYQNENEKAIEMIKKAHVEANETARLMAEENAKLASQLSHYQRCGMSSGPLEATELSLQEALDREAQQKKLEVQLKQEIARLKDELFKAHAELDRREKRVSKTLDDLKSEIVRLRNSLTEEQENHARTCFLKDDLMNSLAENQSFLISQQSTIEQQAAQTVELENKVTTYEEGVGINFKGRRPEFDPKCVRNGLSALTQVSKDESEKVRKLQLELAALRKQYNSKQDENCKSMHILKHQFESSKQEQEKRLQHLQPTRPDIDPEVANEQLAQSRIKALETQVVNIRIHYARKLKELTDKLAESKNEQIKLKLAAENAAQYKKITPTRTIKVKELMDAKERIGTLEDVLELKEHTIRSLEHKLGKFQAEDNGDDPNGASSITVKQVASLSKIKFKLQNNSSQRGRLIHPDKIHDSKDLLQLSQHTGNVPVDSHEAKYELKEQRIKELKRLNLLHEHRDDSPNEREPDIVNLRKRLERTEGSVEALQQQCSEAMQKAARCSIQHQRTLEHLQQASQMITENQPVSTSLSSVPPQEPKTRDSGVSTNIKNTSGAVDWRSYNGSLERENVSLQSKLKASSEKVEEAQEQVRKPMQMQSAAGGHHNADNLASSKREDEVHQKESLLSEENRRKSHKWWQFS